MSTPVPLKRVVSINPETLPEDSEPNFEFRYVDIGSVGRGRLVEEPPTLAFVDAPSRARRVLRPGDTVVSSVRTYLRAVLPINKPGLVGSTGFACLRPRRGLDPRFLGWWAQSDGLIEEVVARSVGVSYPAINPSELGLIRFPMRPVAEQQAIADYLDTETARIDAVVTKKHHMIDLLKDRLTACIRQAVSEGLTASELRETDVAVVPRLPNHWELTRARFVCRVETGTGDTVQAMEDGDYPFFVRSDRVEQSDKFLFDTEAVLTAGDGAGVAKVFHHYSGRFNAHQRVYVMHEFRRVLGRYYYYCLRTLFPLVALDGSAKSTVDSVRRHMLTDMPVPLPPLEEQAQIVRTLDREVERADRMLSALEKQLELLNEHRKALITAAVTGELEVPGVAE